MGNNEQEKPDLYRIEYEEKFEDNTERNVVYVYLQHEEYEQAILSNNFISVQQTTPEQKEAYQMGFEDGVDVATLKIRLENQQIVDNFPNPHAGHDELHHPTEEELLDIFRDEDPQK